MMRVTGLDSLRGIAAAIVVLSHYHHLIDNEAITHHWLITYTPLQFFVAGREAVLLFFMLSGYVLTLPFLSGYQQNYLDFITRRFCRIYIPFFFALSMSMLLYYALAVPHPEVTFPWNGWSQHFTATAILGHYTMLGLTGTESLNPPIWSLIIEMRASIIFPLLVWAILRGNVLTLWFSGVLAYFTSRILHQQAGDADFYEADSIFNIFALTLYYLPYFLIGIFMAVHQDRLKKWMRCISGKMHLIICAVFLCVPQGMLASHFLISEGWGTLMNFYILLATITYTRVNNILSMQPFRWLGRVSFSLYLIQMPIIWSVMYLTYQQMSLFETFMLATAFLVVASELMHRYVEVPSIQIGKKLTQSCTGTLPNSV